MLNLAKLYVGLTGGIGTGKSTALNLFHRMGASTISLDEIAHRLSAKGGPLHRSIIRAFGRRFERNDGTLDRQALAGVVFRSESMRKRLERATHPLILKQMRREMRTASKRVVIVDVPLLFEVGAGDNFDVNVVVSSPSKVAVSRVLRRDRMSRSAVMARIRAQMPIRAKESRADVVIRNEAGLNDLKKQVSEYYRAFDLIASSRGKMPAATSPSQSRN